MTVAAQTRRVRYNGYWYCGPVFCDYNYRRDVSELEARDEGFDLMKRGTSSFSKFRNIMITTAVLGAIEL